MNERTSNVLLSVALVSVLLMAGFSACMASVSATSEVNDDINDQYQETHKVKITEEELNTFVDCMILAGAPDSDIDAVIAEWGETGSIDIMPTIVWFIPFVIGLAIGIGLGIGLGFLLFNGGAPVGNTEQLREELRARLVNDVHNTYNAALGMFQRLVMNDTNILQFTSAYWNLQIDAVVNSIYVPNSSITDIDQIMIDSGTVKNLAIIKHNINSALNMMSYQNRTGDWAANNWSGTDSATYGTASNPKLAMGWQYGSYDWWGDSTSVYMMLGDYVYPTTTNYRVYIDVVTDVSMLINLPNVNAMYITNTAPVTITSVDNPTQTYTLLPGVMNDLYAMGLESGFYDLAPNCGYISPNLLPSMSINGVVPTTGFILNNGGSYAMGFNYAGGYRIINAGNIYDVSDVYFSVRYQDINGAWETIKSVSGTTSLLSASLDAYTAVWGTYENIYLSARNAAQLTWNVLDALEAQTGSYVIRPSAITSGLNTNLNLPLPIETALVLAAMSQLVEQGKNADPSTILISRESVEETIYCYGNVYFQGILIAENAVFTPVIYTSKEKVLHTGTQILEERGNALLIVYAADVPNMGVFTPDPNQFTVLDLTGNVTQLDIFEIWNGTSQVSTVTLEVLEAQALGYLDFGFEHRRVIGVADSTADLWMGLAIFFAGLSFLLAGLLFRGSPVILIIGAIIMLLGILQIAIGLVTSIIDFFSGGIFGFIGGLF